MECTKKLNFFPPKGGISKYYSPREILHHQKLDYNKHCTIPQFSYVQPHNEPNPTNSQAPRSIDCIYLRPLSNVQGGHELLHLTTQRVITRCKVTVIPMPTTVITAVEAMATSDGIKSLQLKTKSGSLLYDSTWIAGVDFIEDKEQEEYHYQENNEDASETYDDIDPNDLAEVLQEDSIQAKLPSNNDPTEQHEDSDAFIEEEDDKDEDEDAIMDEATEEESTQLRRSTRTAKPT